MSRLLHRLGVATAARPWRTIVLWLVLLAATVGVASSVGGVMNDDYTVPGTESQAATEMLIERFPSVAGTDGRVVVHDRSGKTLDAGLLRDLRTRLAQVPGAGLVEPPRMSDDSDTALFTVRYDVPVTELKGRDGVDALYEAARPASDAGLQVELGGQVAENVSEISGTAELVGVAVALVILLIAFGSVVGAGVPLAAALVGLGIGTGGITVMAAVTDVSTSAPTVATMVGLGVGIDYALLLVTRHVEALRRGADVIEAAAEATATAGMSIVFAGSTVLVSLMGLRLAGLPVYASFGFATAIVVALMIATSLTLVPALCAVAGRRLLHRRERASRPLRPELARSSATARWAAAVGRRPLPWALAALTLLLTLAAPTLQMRTWPSDAGSQPESATVRQAYDLVAEEYGAGANGPLVVAVDLTSVPATDLPRLRKLIAAQPGVVAVAPAVLAADATAAILTVEPEWGPQDERSSRLLRTLREQVLPGGAQITGVTAVFADVSELLSERLWLVIAFVVGVSVLLLVVVFRSVLVPVKAALVNTLSVAAAYGVLTAVFQWGWGAELLGLPHAVSVSSWVPILLFAVLFGLSMDYEVFLLSRVREEWLRTGDARGSVVQGLASTGRVITSAALIMVAVFTGFAFDSDVTVKMIGVGMAVAILIDATVVRMVLVPATMSLLGSANWWMPAWAERILPEVDVHGTSAVPVPAQRTDADLVPLG